MKSYLFQFVCVLFSVALLIWRPFPGYTIIGIGAAIILGSIYLTYKGVKDADDDMWWRIALAVIAPLIIGLAQA